ncbi:MAG: hypothetical protein P8186_10095 [Anaerolineae bacterium]|jgi:hypothetical protein
MGTDRPMTIYISAASDLMAEREVLARMIAALPVTLAWHIVQTPLTDADSLDLEALQIADLHLLVMGGDIRAPVGLEWYTVRRVGRPSAAFLKRDIPRTPAGQVFIHDAGVTWRLFSDARDLSRQVQQTLAEHLVRHAVLYALTPDEVAQLEALPTADTPAEQPAQGEEAGHSAVILSRERYVPGEGVIVDEPGGGKK